MKVFEVIDAVGIFLVDGMCYKDGRKMKYKTNKCKPAISCNPYTQRIYHEFQESTDPTQRYWLMKKMSNPTGYDHITRSAKITTKRTRKV